MTETESMVVRVAKELMRVAGVDVFLADDAVPEYWAASARAAIDAMKTPTPGVLAEGYNKLDFDDGVDDSAEEFNRRVVQRVWSAMIVKALEE